MEIPLADTSGGVTRVGTLSELNEVALTQMSRSTSVSNDSLNSIIPDSPFNIDLALSDCSSISHSLQHGEQFKYSPNTSFQESRAESPTLPSKILCDDRSSLPQESVPSEPPLFLFRNNSDSCDEHPVRKEFQAYSSSSSFVLKKTLPSSESDDTRKYSLRGKEELTTESLGFKSPVTEPSCMTTSRPGISGESVRPKRSTHETSQTSPIPALKRSGQSQCSTPTDLMSIDTPSNESVDEDFLNQDSTSSEMKLVSLGEKIIEHLDDDKSDCSGDNVFLSNNVDVEGKAWNITKASDIETRLPEVQSNSEKYNQAIKTELRCKIQIRQEFGDFHIGKRSERVRSSSCSDTPSTPTKEQTTESDLKRKLRNREHAKTSREKAKSERLALMEENKNLEESQRALKAKYESIENMFTKVDTWLSSHFTRKHEKTCPLFSKTDFNAATSQPNVSKSISVLPYYPRTAHTLSSHRQKSGQNVMRHARIGDSLKDDESKAPRMRSSQYKSYNITKYNSNDPTKINCHGLINRTILSAEHNSPTTSRDPNFPTTSDVGANKHELGTGRDISQKNRDPLCTWILGQEELSLNEEDIEFSPWDVGSSSREDKKVNKPLKAPTSSKAPTSALQQSGIKIVTSPVSPPKHASVNLTIPPQISMLDSHNQPEITQDVNATPSSKSMHDHIHNLRIILQSNHKRTLYPETKSYSTLIPRVVIPYYHSSPFEHIKRSHSSSIPSSPSTLSPTSLSGPSTPKTSENDKYYIDISPTSHSPEWTPSSPGSPLDGFKRGHLSPISSSRSSLSHTDLSGLSIGSPQPTSLRINMSSPTEEPLVIGSQVYPPFLLP